VGDCWHLHLAPNLTLPATLFNLDAYHLLISTNVDFNQHFLPVRDCYHICLAPNLTMFVDTGLDLLDAIRTIWNIGTDYSLVDETTERTLHQL
jgi:hypothetical protein